MMLKRTFSAIFTVITAVTALSLVSTAADGRPHTAESRSRALPSGAFVFTVAAAENTGKTVKIHVSHVDGEEVQYDLDCDGDGKFESRGLNGDASCPFDKKSKRIAVQGKIPGLTIHTDGPQKALTVEQWGKIRWKTMNGMFRNCRGLTITAKDSPNLQDVTDMSLMFANTDFNGQIEHWNVSNVKNMSSMFRDAAHFNQPLGRWNTGNVTDMSHMFEGALRFDTPLDTWNTKNVTDMNSMFRKAAVFDRPLNAWDTQNVKNMSSMFKDTGYFDRPLDRWNTKNVTDMHSMFENAQYFDQPLNTWNVENVENADNMFRNAPMFRQTPDTWNLPKIHSKHSLFLPEAGSLQASKNTDFPNSAPALKSYTTGDGSVPFIFSVNMYAADDPETGFEFEWLNSGEKVCRPLNVDAFQKNPATVDGKYVLPIRIHHVKGAEILYDLDCDNDGTFEHTKLTGSHQCVYDVPGLRQVAIRGTVPGLFLGDESSCTADGDLSNSGSKGSTLYMGSRLVSVDQWGNIPWKTTNRMFKRCKSFNVNAADTPYLREVTDTSEMFAFAENFNAPIEHWDMSNVRDMNRMFLGARSFNRPIGRWNTKNVRNMSAMFVHASKFNQPLENWNTENVTDMSFMFCSTVFDRPIEKWNVSNVGNMSGMFFNDAEFSQPLSGWNTKSVADMSYMFSKTQFNRPIDMWNVSNVKNMRGMFSAALFNRRLEQWDVSNVTDMSRMFEENSRFNRPIDSWNVSGVINMDKMFSKAGAFNQPLDHWDLSRVKSMSDIFADAGAFRSGEYYSELIKKWPKIDKGKSAEKSMIVPDAEADKP